MDSTLITLDSGACAPAWNMAFDEALLLDGAARGTAVLRFYGWSEPAVTFGYFQHHAEVAQLTRVRPLIRRPTGGGIVPHLADWTYALAIPPDYPWHALRAVESYRTMHAWIVAAFARLGIESELAPCCRKDAPGQCFIGYEQFDVLRHGRKIAGAAQRRNKFGLLIQGSVQPPPTGIDRHQWQSAMLEALPEPYFSEAQTETRMPALEPAANALMAEKYSQSAYNERR
ncbi:MAG: hypothetical protein IT581_19830 [Verrucomicrobiales bacterium]|nr:hypothetical protein [Verrucomicrobiales bacterium]